MKRIIGGIAYNTATSTLIAQSDAEDDPQFTSYMGNPISRYAYKLYQTRGGAFFLHVATETDKKNLRTGEWDTVERHEFEPMKREEAEKWVLEGNNVELIHDVFGEVPEAEEEETTGVTVYVRMPASLKQRITDRANAEDISVNALMIRYAERGLLSDQGRPSVVNLSSVRD